MRFLIPLQEGHITTLDGRCIGCVRRILAHAFVDHEVLVVLFDKLLLFFFEVLDADARLNKVNNRWHRRHVLLLSKGVKVLAEAALVLATVHHILVKWHN